jgi:branched-chain amino acid transport system ATP-binding protein
VTGLNVWYGAAEVLRDVAFSVPDGRIVALLGGNGSGKTTILNTLSGMVKPRGGSIRLDGAECAGLRPDEIIRLGMAQVPQGREVFASISVIDNLEMGAVTRRDRRSIGRDIDEVLEAFPVLRQKRGARAGGLSGGEQQMVAIARALLSKPRRLLMDNGRPGCRRSWSMRWSTRSSTCTAEG